MMYRQPVAVTLALAVALVPLGACSGQGDSLLERATGTGRVSSVKVVSLPQQILGLQVGEEKVSAEVLDVDRPYIDSVGIFSLRENDLLRATLQVSHLNAVARPRSSAFKRSIINLMGSTNPQQLKVAGTTVYNTTGNKQNLFVWFRERGFYVLSVHEDYEFPRTLLRRIIELEQRF